MAEHAANFTFTFQNKPSIFEVIAQKSLNDTLHPALRRVALFLYTSNPVKFRWLEKYFEETFLMLNGLLQFYYLKYYDGSFSENFYGLKRVLVNDSKMTDRHKKLSLLCIVLLPYLKRKLEDKIAMYRLQRSEGCLRSDFQGVLKQLLMFSHSTFELTWGALTLINYLKYMSGKTEQQLPVLQLLEMKLAYSNEPLDMPGFWPALFRGQLSFSQLSFGLIRNAVTSTLEVSAFFVQFLHTWDSEKSNLSITALPTVQPPRMDNRAKTYRGICPLCLKLWVNPTVVQVSGYIFCFRCISEFIGEHHKCPVTNLPTKPINTTRLYAND